MPETRLVHAISQALHEEMARDPRVVLFGEDVRAGVFGGSRGLFEAFGPSRVRNCPISEQTIAGTALGAAGAGLRPVVDLMIANFLYMAMDQLANQAAKMRYMLGGQLSLPVVFVAAMGGGRSVAAQHSDCPYPVFMNLGGLKVVVPTTPADAKGLMKAAIRDDDPVLYLQPMVLGGERGQVPDGDHVVPIGVASVRRTGADVTVVAIGAMVPRALHVAEALAQAGISVEVIDARTLVPLDHATILESLRKTGRLVIVDEARLTCSAASEVAALAAGQGYRWLRAPVARVAVPDVPMPFSPTLEQEVLPNEERIEAAVREVLEWTWDPRD